MSQTAKPAKRKDGEGKARFDFGDVTRIGKDIVGGVVARRAGGFGTGMLKVISSIICATVLYL